MPVVTFALLKDSASGSSRAAALFGIPSQESSSLSSSPYSSTPPVTTANKPYSTAYGDYAAYSPAPRPKPAARATPAAATTRPTTRPVAAAGSLAANDAPSPADSDQPSADGVLVACNHACRERVGPYAGYGTGAYAIGVVLMLARLAMALVGGQRLRGASHAVDDPRLLHAFARRARLLGLRRPPRLAWCARLVTPCVVGVIRPAILLPASLASGLSLEQLDAILAHELAHVRRRDHWVSLLQRLIEAFLFFHPAVWIISARIRAEREHCCDDLALAAVGGPGHDETTQAAEERQRWSMPMRSSASQSWPAPRPALPVPGSPTATPPLPSLQPAGRRAWRAHSAAA
jgi:hypothetical protein